MTRLPWTDLLRIFIISMLREILLRREEFVGTVAAGGIFRSLALAISQPPFFSHRKFQRGEFGAVMGTVTERLLFRSAAAAPEIGSRFQFQSDRHPGGNFGFGHLFSFHILRNNCRVFSRPAMRGRDQTRPTRLSTFDSVHI